MDSIRYVERENKMVPFKKTYSWGLSEYEELASESFFAK